MFGRKANQNRDPKTVKGRFVVLIVTVCNDPLIRATITRMKKSLFHYCVIDKKDLVLAELLLRFGADPSQD